MIETILAVIVCKKAVQEIIWSILPENGRAPPRILFKTDYIKYAYIFTLKLVRYSFHLLTTHPILYCNQFENHM